MSILVSIIIPAYNVDAYIERCVSSVMRQSYKNIEILVIDDGSQDKTGKIIKTLCTKDKRVKYIYQKNKGLSGARNTGIQKSSGEYLFFLDGDDWIDSDAIRVLIDYVTSDGADICIYNMKYILEDRTEKNNIPHIQSHEIIGAKEALRQELLGNKYKFHAPNKFVKKDIYINNGIFFPEGRLYEDLSTTYKLIANANKITLIDDSLYYYVQNRTGSITSSSISEKMFRDLFAALNDVIEYVKELKWDLDDEIQSLYLENVISFSNYLLDGTATSKKYYNLMRSEKNWKLMDGILTNKDISFIKRCRGFAIAHTWGIYSYFMRIMKGI